MGTKKSDGKRSLKEMEDEGEEEDEETVLGFLGDDEEEKKKRNFSKKGKRGGGGAAAEAACQVDDCTADMSGAKSYYRRHKVCELHARAAVAPVAGLRQRFCQQCSRYTLVFGSPCIRRERRCKSSMMCRSSTTIKGVADIGWPDTMSAAGKAHQTSTTKEKVQVI